MSSYRLHFQIALIQIRTAKNISQLFVFDWYGYTQKQPINAIDVAGLIIVIKMVMLLKVYQLPLVIAFIVKYMHVQLCKLLLQAPNKAEKITGRNNALFILLLMIC
jgi:hypothetical protein